MPVATVMNVLTMVLCCGVLLQSWRMSQLLKRFRTADFPAMVTGITGATEEAEAVLERLRALLANAAEPKLKAIATADRIADELGVMIGLANASADRLQDILREAQADGSGSGPRTAANTAR